jgi:hypothetical protein
MFFLNDTLLANVPKRAIGTLERWLLIMGLCTPKNLPFPATIVIYNINNVYTVFLINLMLF